MKVRITKPGCCQMHRPVCGCGPRVVVSSGRGETSLTERINLRLQPDVKAAWLRAARRERLSLTDWLERVAAAALEEPPSR